ADQAEGQDDRDGPGERLLRHQLACRSALSVTGAPWRLLASTVPETESRRNRRSFWPESSRALTTRPSARVTLVPAVTYRPASSTQSSPREMPMPASAPSRQ